MDELPAPSSFLSSRWSRDNLVTLRPGRLYDGAVLERIEPDAVEALVQELEGRVGALRVGAGRMGVLTWDIACEGADGPQVLQVPRVLDETGSHGRAVRDVPRQNVENMRYFRERGLGRFVLEPRAALLLGHDVPAALFDALPEHHTLGFGRGAVQVERSEAGRTWLVGLGAAATAEALAELVAVLAYHYDAETNGGTAVADVAVNDGDFAVRRRSDGSFDLRLTALRRREPGIAPSLLLLYFTQLLAYEDWAVDGSLTGLPTLMSNPSIAFHGLVRGRRYRERDLGHDEAQGETLALAWIRDFGRSEEGRAYRPWVERFVAGELPLSFGEDLREHWWRVIPLETRAGFRELRGRADPAAGDARSARVLRTFLDRLGRELGRTRDEAPETIRINDLDAAALARLLGEAQGLPPAQPSVVERFFAEWPYRGLDQLVGRLPDARGLRRMKSRLSFGAIVADAEQGSLASLGPLDKTPHAPRTYANRELYGAPLPAALAAFAVETFPTFEAYMDAALHEPTWGYYSRNVVIGSGGHFMTHPEELTPHYGRWIATWAFKAWRALVAHGDITEADPFPIIEFGAGNGRLARDVIDAIASKAAVLTASDHDAWARFAVRARYHVYETSESLRAKQRALLGHAAVVAFGDARRPALTLQRDFPNGVRGFVVTNEVPDAFGVHKVAFTADGDATAALVVPRVEKALCAAVSPELSGSIARASDYVRTTFGFRAHPEDFYLDHATFLATMKAVSELPADRRDPLLADLWFEEAYVPASFIAPLAAELAANAADYAVALAADDSGVVAYVNVHAARFMREIGASLAAGVVVTIDYGDTTFGLVQGARRGDFPFRVYRDAATHRPRPNDPYATPGTQDMTADANFTELARAGRASGLTLVHFGPERDVSGDDLPALVRTSSELSALGKFLGNPVFKVLVLGTRPQPDFAGPLSSALPLFHAEQHLPKARRERVARIQQALARLGPAPGGDTPLRT